MYVHAYQSYVWNAIVSERIRIHGAEKPAIGDLVFEKSEDPELTEEIVDDDAADDEKADKGINDEAGMSGDLDLCLAICLFEILLTFTPFVLKRTQVAHRRDLARPGNPRKSKR